MKYEFEILNSSVLLDDFLNIHEYHLRHQLFAGGQSDVLRRLCLEKQMAVSVLLFDPDQDALVMVEQFRIGARQTANSWLLENPAGYVEAGESVADVAVREVLEETGCSVSDLIPICEFLVSPGISNERIALLCGRVDAGTADGIHGLGEEGEDIKVHVLNFNEAVSEMYTGKINSTSTIMSMQWLMLNKQKVINQWI